MRVFLLLLYAAKEVWLERTHAMVELLQLVSDKLSKAAKLDQELEGPKLEDVAKAMATEKSFGSNGCVVE